MTPPPGSTMDSELIVHKFGGRSIGDAARIESAAEILAHRREGRRIAVVSAIAGVTDTLFRAAELAAARDEGYRVELESLHARHHAIVTELLPTSRATILMTRVEDDLAEISELLRALWLLRSKPRGVLDLITGHGELWSAQILAALLRSRGLASEWLDARMILTAERGEGIARIDLEHSFERLEEWRAARRDGPEVLVVTGYIASTEDGVPITLGRDGGDYSASAVAALFKARSIIIWSDIDGVMSADPRLVPDAVLLDELSYDEAMELAYFGAKVIHPATMGPAIEHGIPIHIRNALEPERPGTRIHRNSSAPQLVKGITSIEELALLSIEGQALASAPGASARLFSALQSAGVTAIMVSQGSSQHSICIAIPAALSERALRALDAAFQPERGMRTIEVRIVRSEELALLSIEGQALASAPGASARLFSALQSAGVTAIMVSQGSSQHSICIAIPAALSERALRALDAAFQPERGMRTIEVRIVDPDCCILAVIGDGMAGRPGVAAKFFGALGRVDVNIRAIAQGSSERNISAVVSRADAVRALRAVHAEFYQGVHNE